MATSDAPAWRRYLRFWGSDVHDDVDEELRFHLAMRASEYAERGMAPDEARRRAEDRFGSVERARGECLDIDKRFHRRLGYADMLRTVLQDLRFALRVLRRQALPALAAVLCLAIGISATTAMFSVADRLLLKPLPYPNGDRLVTVGSTRRGSADRSSPASYLDYLDLRAGQHAFSGLAAMGQTDFIMLRAEASRVSSALVSGNFFATFGVTPEVGRTITDADDRPGAAPVMVVSDAFARREFGSPAAAVGRTVNFNAAARTIVGVIADEWRYPSRTEVWLPIATGGYAQAGRYPKDRGERNLLMYGALRPGTTPAAAERDLDAITARLARQYPSDDADMTARVTRLRETYVGDARNALLIMIGATLAVLLVACANVAALQLARSAARTTEISIRAALGAARGRIVRQLLTESLLLAVAGGAVGTVLALWTRKLVANAVIPGTPAWMTFDLDSRVLLFALGVSCITGVAFGLAPAMRLAKVRDASSLRGTTAGRSRARLQRSFIVLELALSIALVVCAMLALDSAAQMRRVPLGFDPAGVLSMRVALQGPRYDSGAAKTAFVQSLDQRLSALPGVQAVGAADLLPIDGCCSRWEVVPQGQPDVPGHDPSITGTVVTPGYFTALRLRVRSGRVFTDADGAQSPLAMVVNRSFERQYWPRTGAVGEHVAFGNDQALVVGVVEDVRQEGLLNAGNPQFFLAYAQHPRTFMTFVMRTAGDPAALVASARRTLHAIDPGIPAYSVQPLQNVVDQATVQSRGFGRLLTIFAAVALLLAATGLYGVIAFLVASRTRELGVRIALGANPAAVAGVVIRQSAVLTAVGAVAGLALAVAVARWLAATLYGVQWFEPGVYVGATAALAGVAMVATWAPARRASRTDPVTALRAD